MPDVVGQLGNFRGILVAQTVISPAVVDTIRGGAHGQHEIIYVLKGLYGADLEAAHWRGKPGDVFLYPAGCWHRPSLPLNESVRLLVLQWDPSLADSPVGRPCRARDGRGRLLTTIAWLLDLRLDAGAEALSRQLLGVALTEFARLHVGGDPGHNPIERVRHAMHENVANRGLTLSMLAKLAEMSPAHFCRTFRARTGEAPFANLRRLRVEAALPLIAETDLPFAEIATRVGLCSAAHLWRLVVEHTGRPPSSFRRLKGHGG
jgi:AraC-like DNA-binding protein